MPSCVVLTWMVDQTWAQPHGTLPRPVRLHDDYNAWETRILQAWQDLRDQDAPYEFYLAHPTPPTTDNTVVAHVVLVQRPRDDWITSVVTCFDHGLDPPHMSQAAITTHAYIWLENLLRVLSYFHACVGTNPTHRCHAWHGQIPLTMDAPLIGRSGYSITIQVQPLYSTASGDETHLLQQSLISQGQPSRERLTTDAVAQAQWPREERSFERCQSACTLQLQKLIPSPAVIRIDFQPVIHVRDIIFTLDLGIIHPRASVVKWHSTTQDAFDTISDWHGETPTGLSFFTDGSAARLHDDRCASAAMVCIVH